jgi:hypothetical protein
MQMGPPGERIGGGQESGKATVSGGRASIRSRRPKRVDGGCRCNGEDKGAGRRDRTYTDNLEPLFQDDLLSNMWERANGNLHGRGSSWERGEYEPPLASATRHGSTWGAVMQPAVGDGPEVHGTGRGCRRGRRADPAASLSQSTGGEQGSDCSGHPDDPTGIVV